MSSFECGSSPLRGIVGTPLTGSPAFGYFETLYHLGHPPSEFNRRPFLITHGFNGLRVLFLRGHQLAQNDLSCLRAVKHKQANQQNILRGRPLSAFPILIYESVPASIPPYHLIQEQHRTEEDNSDMVRMGISRSLFMHYARVSLDVFPSAGAPSTWSLVLNSCAVG